MKYQIISALLIRKVSSCRAVRKARMKWYFSKNNFGVKKRRTKYGKS